jgi:hypothetical protein
LIEATPATLDVTSDLQVLADWLEQKGTLDNLVETLRGIPVEPCKPPESTDRTLLANFRWRQVDRELLLHMAQYWLARAPGVEQAERRNGYLLGLYQSESPSGSARRWLYWFPADMLPAAAQRLWDELGASSNARHQTASYQIDLPAE